MEAIQTVFSTLGVIALPASWMVLYVGNLGKRLTASEVRAAAHEATDTATFEAIKTTLGEIKNEQRTTSSDMKAEMRDQTSKLDRLVEKFLKP